LTVKVNAFTLTVKCGSTTQCKAKFVTQPLRRLVLAAAKELFMTRGYDAVGMRDIASAVGRQPVQIYRLNLPKSDILAELIIELNAGEIVQLPELLAKVRGGSLIDRVCGYFLELYRLDIQFMPIRSVGAAFGWMWNTRYEQKIIEQVLQLLQPVAEWMAEAGLDAIAARGYGIWSVYYVGFRRAAIHGGSAEECVAEIRPTLEILLHGGAGAEPAACLPKGEVS
jgi:AcrR family transcriptional regulator